MARPIIGLCGFARSGKDSVAATLLHSGWVRVAFADELKADLERCIGRPFAAMSPEEKELWRPLMVEYGRTRRKQSPGYWIDRAAAHLRATHAPGVPAVITDVRYANEVKWVQDRGGLVVYVNRGNPPANEEEADNTAACLRLIPARDTIDNTGTLVEARLALVAKVLEHYGRSILL